MERKILHLDLDAFFCAVEEQRDPSLTDLPFAVGGQPDKRGVVSSCSYAARVYGVRSALPMAQAVRLCPDLIIVSPHFDDYRAASKSVMEILHDFTPLVEQLSIDEAFMDMTGVKASGLDVAEDIQARIRDELGLPCSIGVASNKLMAKTANNIGKASRKTGTYPNAITEVQVGKEAEFLAPLPIRELWGVGAKTAEKLRSEGINTIGQLAALPKYRLVEMFGKNGADFYERARGIDTRQVETEHTAKSVSKETTYMQDVADLDTLQRTLQMLADGVGHRLRKAGLRGDTVKIKLRWSDFTTITRQMTLQTPTDHDAEIYDAAVHLLKMHWKGTPVRLIGVGVTGFDAHQLQLWSEPAQPNPLESALDRLKSRFGDNAVGRASNLLSPDLGDDNRLE